MSLTAKDLEQITTIVQNVTTPRFDAIDNRFDQIDQSIEHLAITTMQQFEAVLKDLDKLKDDTIVVKDYVKDHDFRLAKLQHRHAN